MVGAPLRVFTITTAWEKVKPSCTTRHTQPVIHRVLACLIKSLEVGKLEVSCVLLGPHCNWNSVAVTSTAVELLYYWVYFARKELWWWLLNSSPRIIEPGLTKGPRAHAMWLSPAASPYWHYVVPVSSARQEPTFGMHQFTPETRTQPARQQ